MTDPLFGTRAHLDEVVARKLAMYDASRDPKHARDLLEIDLAGLCPPALRAQLNQRRSTLQARARDVLGGAV